MKIIIPVKIYQKLRAYVDNCEFEISGMGKIEKDGDNYRVVDLIILKQLCSASTTDLDRKALGNFYDKIIDEEGNLSGWKLWWHSHADMKVFFSGTDDKTIADFDSEAKEENWMLSLVTNHKADILIRADVFAPIKCTVKNVEYEIDYGDEEIKEAALDEITENVTPFFIPITGNYLSYRNKNKEFSEFWENYYKNRASNLDDYPILMEE